MDASVNSGREGEEDDDEDGDESPPRPSGESDWHPGCFSDLSPSMYAQRRGGRFENPHVVKNTHKYCLFLACLKSS